MTAEARDYTLAAERKLTIFNQLYAENRLFVSQARQGENRRRWRTLER